MMSENTKVYGAGTITMSEIVALTDPNLPAATIIANQHGTEWAIFADGRVLCEGAKVVTFDSHIDAITALFSNNIDLFFIQRKPPADFTRRPTPSTKP